MRDSWSKIKQKVTWITGNVIKYFFCVKKQNPYLAPWKMKEVALSELPTILKSNKS